MFCERCAGLIQFPCRLSAAVARTSRFSFPSQRLASGDANGRPHGRVFRQRAERGFALEIRCLRCRIVGHRPLRSYH